MNLYKIIENSEIDNNIFIDYEKLDIDELSIIIINPYLKSRNYPIFSGGEMDRMRFYGKTLIYHEYNKVYSRYIWLVDIDHPSQEGYFKIINRDSQLKNILTT